MFSITLTILTVISNLFLGLIILRRNSKNATNVTFASLTIIISIWAILNYFSLQTLDPQSAIIWIRAVMISVALMFPNIYLLARVFPDNGLQLPKSHLLTTLIESLLVVSLSATSLIFSKVTIIGNSVSPVPGPAVFVFGLHVLTYLFLTLFTLIRKRKMISKVYLPQINLMLIGLSLTFLLSFLTTFVFVVILHNTNFVIFGPPYTIFLIGCIAYAIIRHKFLDITSIIARAVSYTLVLAVVILIEAGILWLGTTLLPTNIDRTLVAFAGSILIVLGYSSLRSVITGLTDKIFFQGRYDTEVVLKTLTSIMVTEMNVRILTNKLLKVLISDIKISEARIVLVSDFVTRPMPSLDPQDQLDPKSARLEALLHRVKQTMLFDELTDEVDKELFRELNISLILPLTVSGEDIGLLVLGPKSSGDIYSVRDIEVLEIFAPQAAIALKNADSYRQIQEFSRTLESKVIERTHQLEAAQASELKLKDEFVFIATHDLATPVTAISGFSAMINARKEKISTELKSDLSAITEASNRLKVLVNDLLQVARSDSGTIKVELVRVDAGEIIQAAVREITPAATEKKVQVILSLAKDNHIQADPKKLAEIIENLLSNGVKYNKEGGTLTITTVQKPSSLIIEFKDTGLGIPLSEQSKVFTKFFRSEEAEVRQRPGTGLGLFVVRMLTEKMGGNITFKSVEDQGTTFWLEFKL